MDKIDKKILAELQADGRLSVTELAHKVGLSLSPCHRRVKALEDAGIIKGYRAQLDISQLGLRKPVRFSQIGELPPLRSSLLRINRRLTEVSQRHEEHGDRGDVNHLTYK